MDALCSGNNPGGIPGGSTSPTIKFDMTKLDVHSGLATQKIPTSMLYLFSFSFQLFPQWPTIMPLNRHNVYYTANCYSQFQTTWNNVGRRLQMKTRYPKLRSYCTIPSGIPTRVIHPRSHLCSGVKNPF